MEKKIRNSTNNALEREEEDDEKDDVFEARERSATTKVMPALESHHARKYSSSSASSCDDDCERRSASSSGESSNSSDESCVDDDFDDFDEHGGRKSFRQKKKTKTKEIKKLFEAIKRSAREIKIDLFELLSAAKKHANDHAESTSAHVDLHKQTIEMYCDALNSSVSEATKLMRRVVLIASNTEKLKQLEIRTSELRERAEVMESLCIERGIVVADGTKRNNSSANQSPLVAAVLSPLRFFRPSGASSLLRVSPTTTSNAAAKTDAPPTTTAITITSTPTTTRPPRPKSPVPKSSTPQPFDKDGIIAQVVQRKKEERMREIECMNMAMSHLL